jgi:hypothetical protein
MVSQLKFFISYCEHGKIRKKISDLILNDLTKSLFSIHFVVH